MTVDRWVRLLAGLFILLSLAFALPASPLFLSHKWLWFTAFVGFNLAQSALTGFCPAAFLLRALGVKESAGAPE